MNRGRIAVGGAAAQAWSPLMPGSMLLWINADYTTDSGPGTNISAVTDQSPNGTVVVEGVAGQGPTHLAASGRRGKKSISFSGVTSTLRSTDAALLALATGAAKDFTMAWVIQPTNGTTTYVGGWGLTSNFNNFCYVRRGNNSLVWEITRRDPTNNTTPALDTPKGFFWHVLSIEHDAAAHTIQAKIDGVAIGAPVAFPWAATAARDIYTIGSIYAQAETKTSYHRCRHHMIWSKKLSASDSSSLHEWGAAEAGAANVRMQWKRGFAASATFGNGSNAWLVIMCVGDSQGAGRGTVPYASIYANTTNVGYCLYPDGNLAPLDGTHTVDPTDIVGGVASDTGAGVADPWTRMVDYLRANGETRNIMVVNRCKSGSTSGQWNTGLATNPPAANQQFGASLYYLDEALKAPNAELRLVICHGGTNAAEPPTPAGATVASLTTDWRAVIDAYFARYSSYITKTEWVTWCRPPLTAAAGYSGHWNGGDTTFMRQAIDAFCTASADVGMIDDPDGPFIDVDTHLETGSNTPGSETGLLGMGVRAAQAILAAT